MNSTEYKKLRNVVKQRIMGLGMQDSKWYDVIRAINIAEQYHTGLRKDGITPEIYHQYSMAGFALTLLQLFPKVSVEVLVTIFLHDTIEDYPETVDIIQKELPEYYHFVEGMSKEKRNGKMSNDEYYGVLGGNVVLSIVKSIDRTHNLSTALALKEEKINAYIVETREYVLPMIKIAKRYNPEYDCFFEHMKSVINIITTTLENRSKGE